MSVLSVYEDYRDRAYRLINVFFPVQQSLDIITGNDEDLQLQALRRSAGLDINEPADDDNDDEEEDDESSDGEG